MGECQEMHVIAKQKNHQIFKRQTVKMKEIMKKCYEKNEMCYEKNEML